MILFVSLNKFLTFYYFFSVVECPSEDYLESFVNHTAFAQYQTTSSENNAPYCIIHFTPQKVMDDPRYMDWMDKFDLNTRHIVLNEKNECMGTEANHRHQHKLRLLHSDIFPLFNEESFEKKTRVRLHIKISFISRVLIIRCFYVTTNITFSSHRQQTCLLYIVLERFIPSTCNRN